MAYDEGLADRVRNVLKRRRGISERNMFGGLSFLVNGNMSCGVVGDVLMVRVGPERYQEALGNKHARVMDFTGTPLRGYVYVERGGHRTAPGLKKWVGLGVDFARSLPKKAPKKKRVSRSR